MKIKKAPRNRTITLSEKELSDHSRDLMVLQKPVSLDMIRDRILCQDVLQAFSHLPSHFADLVFLDPPYNLNKSFEGERYQLTSIKEYSVYLDSWMKHLPRLLKPTASVYICGDWRSSTSIHSVAQKYFKIRNRISWEREKGRGAKANWKNTTEDIWFCTMSDSYVFNIDDVKIKRKVMAPYREKGMPKDWSESEGQKHRLTHPSNLWTDITVPFWSMPENTDHPTQKPEKLLAKIILASSKPGDIVFDPFLGSGTTAVVAAKLGRHFLGIEKQLSYACLAVKRLELAQSDMSIQGYSNGVFWERNSLASQKG